MTGISRSDIESYSGDAVFKRLTISYYSVYLTTIVLRYVLTDVSKILIRLVVFFVAAFDEVVRFFAMWGYIRRKSSNLFIRFMFRQYIL